MTRQSNAADTYIYTIPIYLLSSIVYNAYLMLQLKQFQSKQQESGQQQPIDHLPAVTHASEPVFSDLALGDEAALLLLPENQSFSPPRTPPAQQYEMPAVKHSNPESISQPPTPRINFEEVMAAITQREMESNEQFGTLKRSPDLGLDIAELEAQQELELTVERQRNSELTSSLRSQISLFESLQNEMQMLKVASSTRSTMELGPLQEQLRAHVQTIGVLVGEKAELAAGLNKFQGLAKQKCEEVEVSKISINNPI